MFPQVKRTSGQSFFNWDLFPNREVCTPALLTPEGAVQQIKLGEHMREAYLEKWKLLPSETAWDKIKVLTLLGEGNFCSVSAFSSSFYHCDLEILRAHLYQASVSTLRQLCDDASDTVLMQNNGVARKWVVALFRSDSIVFNENSITSVIAALMLTLGVNEP